jgi:hypothetical protein
MNLSCLEDWYPAHDQSRGDDDDYDNILAPVLELRPVRFHMLIRPVYFLLMIRLRGIYSNMCDRGVVVYVIVC